MLNILNWFRGIETTEEDLRKTKTERRIISDVEKSLESSEFEQNDSLLSKIIDFRKCPDCNVWDMYNGPSGGMSTNIYCGNCGSHFNHCSGFVTGRIREVNITQYKTVIPLTKQIIRKWHHVPLSIDQGWGGEDVKARQWCEENCNGKWAVNSWHFYFENEADAAPFKLVWVEQ